MLLLSAAPISSLFFPPIGPLGIHLMGTAAGDPRGVSPVKSIIRGQILTWLAVGIEDL